MSMRAVLAAVVLVHIGAPGTAAAEHVGITADVSAKVAEVRERSVTVEVSWGAACTGASGPASFSGNLELIDQASGERIYLGGVASASGSASQTVDRRDHGRDLVPWLRIACWEDASLHGGTTEAVGPAVAIPARERAGSGDPGSGAGGPGDGQPPDSDGGSVPPPPAGLPRGACAVELRGTSAADDLVGTRGHDRILGLAGADLLRGAAGHDCLHGGAGPDRLRGGRGADALYGGRGRDRIAAADGTRDLVRCGPGRDRAVVDREDRVRGCERVRRVG